MGNIFSFELMCCDKITSGCWDCVAGQAIYTYQLEESLSELKTALDELKEQRADVIRKVNIAEQQCLKPLNQVQGWLSRTATMTNEVDQRIIDGKKEMKNLCMGGCCSMNYRSTLKFSKTVVKRLHDVKVLKRKGAFEVVAMEVPAALAVERPCDSSVGMESMLNKVWSILEEKHARIVGFRIAKVQDDIAKRIGLFSGMWGEKSVEEKAMDIFRVLREKKFVVLMDDVWERVDVLKVGIPLPTYENGSKIIFTTRSNEVCGQMRAHKKIEVQCLTEEQAWELFEQHVGNDILDGHPNIRDLAHEVARECGGLPLALITIGRAMACKRTPEEWEYAIQVLKRSANSVFPDMDEVVYPLLKFSFDCLPNDLVRCCLLYCSLFPEDYRIPKEIFIDCCIVEGFMDEYESISQARKQGHHIIGSLIHSCLLFIGRTCRLYAHKWKFFVRAGYELTQVPEVGKWRGIRQLPTELKALEKLKCLKLEYLLDGIRIPRGLISGFSKLQMLKMMGSFLFNKSAAKDNNECLVEEMQSLNNLNELSMSVTSAFALERLMSAEMLHTCTKQIGLHSFRDSKQLNILSLANFKCLNYIQISKCESLEEVKTEMDITRAKAPNQTQIPVVEHQMCFQSLVKVYISGCSTLRDITWLILAQNLRHFIVINCHKMEEIINEIKLSQIAEMVGTLSPFAKLKSLYLQYLPELKSIYKDALPFSCMKDIHVYACPKLTRLPLNSDSAKRNEIRIHGKEKWWKEMHWEDESTRNAFLPCFIAEVILLSPLSLFFDSLHVCFQKVTFLSFCFVLEKHVDLKQGNHSCSYPLTCLTWLTEDEEPSERTITYCSKSADCRRL
ncbi:hypothetical protein GOBAR_AA22658 [Gossypium barbadense]|uniref:Uncharacterized protein n=1 Tax=Gossypium barbadense TaxID=3634 RepID=A0A2P5X3V7_GOSBA|nr:hypothetical protein GOBAR_AA22658 [Gossypium barbadense]